jgi:hypothetical protein
MDHDATCRCLNCEGARHWGTKCSCRGTHPAKQHAGRSPSFRLSGKGSDCVELRRPLSLGDEQLQ